VCAAAQPLEQVVQPFTTTAVVGRQVFGQRHVGDRFDGAAEMVEDEQRVDHHQVRQRQVERVVGRRGDARLELPGELVGQVADGAAAEARQPGQPGHAFASDHAVDQVQRVGVAQIGRPFAALVGGVIVVNRERALQTGSDERVARHELAALDTFEQEAARSGAQLEQRRDGRFQVGQDLAVDRRVVRRRRHTAQVGQAGVHVRAHQAFTSSACTRWRALGK
jgi:hypothetical protein